MVWLNNMFDQFSQCIETILSLRLDSRRGLTSFIGQHYQSSFEVLNYLNNLDLESPCTTVQSISGVLLYFFYIQWRDKKENVRIS